MSVIEINKQYKEYNVNKWLPYNKVHFYIIVLLFNILMFIIVDSHSAKDHADIREFCIDLYGWPQRDLGSIRSLQFHFLLLYPLFAVYISANQQFICDYFIYI